MPESQLRLNEEDYDRDLRYVPVETISHLNAHKVTILLVEQNIQLALKISHHAFVLKTGHVTMMGRGEELLGDPEIQKAYMGSLR